jgi:hypothetical protein
LAKDLSAFLKVVHTTTIPIMGRNDSIHHAPDAFLGTVFCKGAGEYDRGFAEEDNLCPQLLQ